MPAQACFPPAATCPSFFDRGQEQGEVRIVLSSIAIPVNVYLSRFLGPAFQAGE
jgi:hypothetical protein